MKSTLSPIHTFVYRHRLAGKRLILTLKKLLPKPLAKHLISFAEKIAFRVTPQYQGDTLPPIFHYWSGKYVAPKLSELGFRSPEDLYFSEIKAFSEAKGAAPISVVSFGSGAATLELDLLERLRGTAIDVRILCVDFNKSLKDRAQRAAAAKGLASYFDFMVADCNRLHSAGLHDLVIVNQFFHHVDEIDGFCALIQRSLRANGALLTCDVIGRNGHVLWPSVDTHVQSAWQSLHAEKTYDRHFGSRQDQYVSIDHAAYSNEGVRAQDIVAGLSKTFDFETFMTYGAVVMPFVERRIGHNFDPECDHDRDFIDRIAANDEAAIASGRYPASNMIAVLRHRGMARFQRHLPVSPDTHVRLTRSELAASCG